MSEHHVRRGVRRGQTVVWLVLGGLFAAVGTVNIALAVSCGELWPAGVAVVTLLAALGSVRGALEERRRTRTDHGRPLF